MPTVGKSAADKERNDIAALKEREAPSASFVANGALTRTSGIKALTKATAGAYTLAAPTAAEEGAEITLMGDTAVAHVVTATGLIANGTTGGFKNTMTFPAFAGASITLQAHNLKWNVKAVNNVVVA